MLQSPEFYKSRFAICGRTASGKISRKLADFCPALALRFLDQVAGGVIGTDALGDQVARRNHLLPAAGRLPYQAHRGAAPDVALADLDGVLAGAEVGLAAVELPGDFARIGDHVAAVDFYPSRVVHDDRELIDAGHRRDQLAGP